MTLQTKNIHTDAYVVAIVFIAISLPLSKFTMSIGEFLLLGLWLLSGFHFRITKRFFKAKGTIIGLYYFFGYIFRLIYNNFIDKMAAFFKNKAAVILSSIWLMHIIGLLNTADFHYAIKDLRVKLPLLLFPIIFSTIQPVNYRTFRKIILFYVVAVFAGTLISFSIFLRGNYYDIRDISPFISSIRFGLNITFSFFILLYFIFSDGYFKNRTKIVFGFICLWFLMFLVIMESITSLSAIIIIGIGILVYFVFVSRYFYLKVVFTILLIGIPAGMFLYVRDTVISATTPPKINPKKLDKLTALHNPYIFDTVPAQIEDGKYVGLYICYKEMKKAWNKRSKFDFDGMGKNGSAIKPTLIRYLTSKNLRKDAAGIKALTDKDIRLIENGVANYNYIAHPGLHTRILKIIMGYDSYKATGNPSGSSIMQRVEYLKASINLIKEHFWFGVGTGDLENAFYKEFDRMHSKLKNGFRFHAHNQYLAMFIAFGVFGFLYFIFAIIYPVVITGAIRDYFFTVFYLIMLISMFSDDTLETQAGATLFGFFIAFLMLGKKRENIKKLPLS